ncbi:hypothetical protein [Mesorhizobium sp. ES1-4]|uniref:hypothetical protein n=1 Tax=Mesorhizobium sp. ES1-4 TaxID=2876627 RepID=UPI001CCB70DD|nr:hypothetical protein [Mesorhizobium sp. ES1-4]MBZ9799077.1 hypothetical protein [Mesorhizobium sp. ES1-4]
MPAAANVATEIAESMKGTFFRRAARDGDRCWLRHDRHGRLRGLVMEQIATTLPQPSDDVIVVAIRRSAALATERRREKTGGYENRRRAA